MKRHPTQGDILIALSKGATLSVQNENGERTYHINTDKRPCDPKTIQAMLDSGLIEPSNDGLFGDTQTYRRRTNL